MHRLTEISLEYSKTTLLVVALITVVLGIGLTRVRTEFGYRVLVGDDHPTIQTLDHFIGQYGGGLPILIAWPCGDGEPCSTVFARNSLEMAASVTESLLERSEVHTVLGLANAPVLLPAREGFSVRRFVENGQVVPDVATLTPFALSDPLWLGTLVSEGAGVGAILVQPVDNRPQTTLRVFEYVEEILARPQLRGFDFQLVGEGPATIVGGRDLSASSGRLIPVMVVVIAIVLLFLSRSWAHAAVTLGTMGLGLFWTLGFLGWLGWPRDGILEVLAPLILVIGVCDGVHLLARYSVELGSNHQVDSDNERKAALLRVARDLGAPCLMTTLTTAAAFLSFVTSALSTFVRFGVVSAFGVSCCLLLTFTLLPVLARRLPGRAKASGAAGHHWETALMGIVRVAGMRTRPILVGAAVFFVVCAAGWKTGLRVDNDWLESFGEQSRAVQSVRFVESTLGPSDTLEIEITLPEGVRLEEPETLSRVESFSSALEQIQGLGDTRSIVDLVKRLNRLVHSDDPAYEMVGETMLWNAELIELAALEGRDVVGSWVTLDRSAFRLSVQAKDQSFSDRKAGMSAVSASARSLLPDDWKLRFSGEYTAAMEWVQDVQDTQVRSFPSAFVLVLVIVAAFLRSIRLGLAAMVPTVLPVVTVLGTMGWMGMNLDVGRAMIAAVVIGIAVDDSIHLLYQYKIRREAGDGPHEAIRAAVLHVGRAVVTTSVALALGFLTLMASAWQTIASFGFLVSLAILGALVASLFVLPALIFAFAREEG